MLTNLIFLLLLAAPCVFAAARYGKRFEATIPVSIMGWILVLFAFGLAGMLQAGLLFLCGVSAVAYVIALETLIRKRNFRRFFEGMITPGSLLFLLAWIFLTIWNEGKMAHYWDEFANWVDVVKAAVEVNDFGTNPEAHFAFPATPPAMMLFQYALQKVGMFLDPAAGFVEWRVYFAFQVFIVACFMPLFQNICFSEPSKLLLYTAITFLAPLLFYTNLYSCVYIYPVVGILFGTGMSVIVLRPRNDLMYKLYSCLACATLTLMLEGGLAFAWVLALAFGVDQILEEKNEGKELNPMAEIPESQMTAKDRKKKRLGEIMQHVTELIALPAMLIPRLLWKWEMSSSGIQVSSERKVDWKILLDVILGKDESYRSEVVQRYRDALYIKTIPLGNINLEINYIALTLLFISAIYLIWRVFHAKQHAPRRWFGRFDALLGFSILVIVGYMMGLCVTYMFKHSQFDALRLASMERYMNMAFLGIWLFVLLLFAHWACLWSPRKEAKIVMLGVILLLVPTKNFGDFTRGDYIDQAYEIRAPYEALSDAVQEHCDGDDRIYFISQATTGIDYWISRFNCRTNTFNDGGWSIGKPFYDTDQWTVEMTPEQWQEILLDQYDYVAIYEVNDYFLATFGKLFSEPEAIETSTLYRVNRQTGLLDKCK